MSRGGERLGSPGTSYSQRTDLMAQPIRTSTNQTYGEAKAQADAQRAMPLAGGPAEPEHPAIGSLYAPTARPDEPVTAGIDSGPGPGPAFGGALNDRDILAALARKYPGLPGLDRMIAEMR